MKTIRLELFLSFFILIQHASGQLDRTFEPVDIYDIEYVSSPTVSHDGSRVLYQRNYKDIMTDKNLSNIWMINADGTDNQPVTTGNQFDSSPIWSPDGQKILFKSNKDGSSQLYLKWLSTGATAKISNLNQGTGSLRWSPDGQHLAFTMFVKDPSSASVKISGKPEGAKWNKPPILIDDLNYRADGAGYLKDGYRQIFLMSIDGGTPKQLTFGPFNHGTPEWSKDGQHLFFSANHYDDIEQPRNSEIHKVDISTGEVSTLTDRFGPDQSPKVSPDGSSVAYLGLDDQFLGYQITDLYVMDADGGNKRCLTKDFDRSVGNINWNGDGTGLYFQYTDEGMGTVGHVSLNGDITQITSNVGGLSIGRPYSGGTYTVSDNGVVAFTHSTPERPAELGIWSSGNTIQATNINADLIDQNDMGEVEEIWYTSSHDGRKVQGWICKPPDFDPNEKYPLLLEIHGGPFASYGPHFSAEVQMYAAKGYVVLYTNPRGSSSYGAEFGNLIHHNYPGEDYDDLMSGVDAVIDKGYIDEDQLYVTGGSGGGVLTAWIVGHTDRFRGAVVAKPVINWYSFVLYADGPSFFYKYWFPGKPWDHLEHYMKRSPISYAANVTTPTMLLTGEEDYRTPMAETEQYYAALKLNGVPSSMVRIPGASHGIAAKPSNLIAKVAAITQWFDEHSEDIEREEP